MYCHTVTAILAGFFLGITIARDLTQWNISKNYEFVELNYKDLLLNILRKDFRGSKTTVIRISENCLNCDTVLNTLMESLNQSFFIGNKPDFTNIRRMMGNQSSDVYNISEYKFVIILVNNFDELFENFENLRQQYNWNPRAKHLIVTTAEPSGKKLQLFFDECWKHRVLNVGVSISNSQEFYTYNRYLSDSPYEKVDASNLFYDKLRDMMGYPIRVKYIPLMNKNMAKWIPEKNKFMFFDIDWGYSQILFKSINATPEYLNLTNEDVRRFSNFTYRLSYWKHREFGRAELWLNAISTNYKFKERSEELYPYAEDGAYIIAPKSSQKIMSVFNTCDKLTWMSIGVSFMLFNLYMRILYEYENFGSDRFLFSYAIFFGQYFPKIKNFKPIAKIIFHSWAVFGAFLLTAHTNVLYSVLTTPSYNPEVDEIKEVSFHTNTMYTSKDLHDIIVGYVTSKKNIILLDIEDYYEYMLMHRNYFYTLPLNLADFLVQQPKLQSETGVPYFHMVKECLVPMYSTFFVPYGSPFLEKMNRAIGIVKETGLQQYWDAEVNSIAVLSGKIILHENEFRVPKPLTIWTQILTFSIWISGLLISFFCCAYEVYIEK